jgi:hypothetical protein
LRWLAPAWLTARWPAHSQTGGPGGFALESAAVWNFLGLAPESFRTLPFLAAFAVLCGATACGPSGGGGAPATYIIVFTLSDLPEGDDLTSLEFNVAYDVGNFSGTGAAVVCELVDSGDTAEFNDDNAGVLNVKIDATDTELEEDDDIVECDFVSNVQPIGDDFTITIVESAPSDEEDVTVVVTSTELEGAAVTGSADEPAGDGVE